MKSEKSGIWELIVAAAVVLALGWLDYVTGDELDLFVLYFLPVVGMAWRRNFRASLVVSALAVLVWAVANVFLGHAYSIAWMGWWGGAVMLAMFSAAGWAAAHIRADLRREQILNEELRSALARIKRLTGRLPICLSCKSIQDASGAWREIEEYFTHQSEEDFIFSHTVCPHCRPAGRGREASALVERH